MQLLMVFSYDHVATTENRATRPAKLILPRAYSSDRIPQIDLTTSPPRAPFLNLPMWLLRIRYYVRGIVSGLWKSTILAKLNPR